MHGVWRQIRFELNLLYSLLLLPQLPRFIFIKLLVVVHFRVFDYKTMNNTAPLIDYFTLLASFWSIGLQQLISFIQICYTILSNGSIYSSTLLLRLFYMLSSSSFIIYLFRSIYSILCLSCPRNANRLCLIITPLASHARTERYTIFPTGYAVTLDPVKASWRIISEVTFGAWRAYVTAIPLQ